MSPDDLDSGNLDGAHLDIGTVAERSGLPNSTLHLWEARGLITPVGRSGLRRVYASDVLDRLAIIVVCQRSGFSLREIGELLAPDAFRDGKQRLERKLGELEARRVELDTAIEGIRHALDCGEPNPLACEDFRQHLPGVLPVAKSPKNEPPAESRMAIISEPVNRNEDEKPIACTLNPDAVEQRVEEWRRLVGEHPDVVGAVTAREAIEGGVRLRFDDGVDTNSLVNLATAEYDCCRFFGFRITIDHRGVGLEVTAPAEGQAVLDALFGVAAPLRPDSP